MRYVASTQGLSSTQCHQIQDCLSPFSPSLHNAVVKEDQDGFPSWKYRHSREHNTSPYELGIRLWCPVMSCIALGRITWILYSVFSRWTMERIHRYDYAIRTANSVHPP